MDFKDLLTLKPFEIEFNSEFKVFKLKRDLYMVAVLIM